MRNVVTYILFTRTLLTVVMGVVVIILMYTQYLIYIRDILFSGECLVLASSAPPNLKN